jgi:Kef-type K+ transport system membrane component KefB
VALPYLMGFGFLLFLASQDIDPSHFRDPMLRPTGTAYVVSLALAFPVALGLIAVAPGSDLRLIALSLTSSPLGILAPVVRDSGDLNTDLGQLTVLAATVGEFSSLLLLTALFSADAKSTPEQILYVALMGLAAAPTGSSSTPCGGPVALEDCLRHSTTRRPSSACGGAFVVLLIFAALA